MATELPYPTHHAAARWRQRADQDRQRIIGPIVAWEEATTVDEPHGLEGDEVRYHPPTDTALVRKNDALVTVVRVEMSSKRTLQQAVQRVDGGEVA